MLIISKEIDLVRPSADHVSQAAESPMVDDVFARRIRRRIRSGAYESFEVIDKIARRVLDAGDL